MASNLYYTTVVGQLKMELDSDRLRQEGVPQTGALSIEKFRDIIRGITLDQREPDPEGHAFKVAQNRFAEFLTTMWRQLRYLPAVEPGLHIAQLTFQPHAPSPKTKNEGIHGQTPAFLTIILIPVLRIYIANLRQDIPLVIE